MDKKKMADVISKSLAKPITQLYSWHAENSSWKLEFLNEKILKHTPKKTQKKLKCSAGTERFIYLFVLLLMVNEWQ